MEKKETKELRLLRMRMATRKCFSVWPVKEKMRQRVKFKLLRVAQETLRKSVRRRKRENLSLRCNNNKLILAVQSQTRSSTSHPLPSARKNARRSPRLRNRRKLWQMVSAVWFSRLRIM